jgi:hypothetical protein
MACARPADSCSSAPIRRPCAPHLAGVSAAEHGQLVHGPVAVVVVALRVGGSALRGQACAGRGVATGVRAGGRRKLSCMQPPQLAPMRGDCPPPPPDRRTARGACACGSHSRRRWRCGTGSRWRCRRKRPQQPPGRGSSCCSRCSPPARRGAAVSRDGGSELAMQGGAMASPGRPGRQPAAGTLLAAAAPGHAPGERSADRSGGAGRRRSRRTCC